MSPNSAQKPNIILIGFSTTGKSRAGWLLARRLGWAYVDTDAWVAGMARKSIPDVFADQGELHFRELERVALEEALMRRRAVIATGGGAVLYQTNREKMAQRGWIVLLEATPETILRRLQDEDAASQVPIRPLLAGEDPLRRIVALKEERQHLYYSLADFVVDTDRQTVEEVVDRLMEVARQIGIVQQD